MDSPSQYIVTPEASMLESADVGSGSKGESPPIVSSQATQIKIDIDDAEEFKDHDIPKMTPLDSGLPLLDGGPSTSKPTTYDSEYIDASGPASIFLPSRPTKKEWAGLKAACKTGIAMTGVAVLSKVGPGVGLANIGETDDSYVFRVALPGVKQDNSEFSCEVEPSGKVLIKGVTTTGEKTVYKCSQVFEMKTQNLCPPGHFSISIQLPGPIDPQKFSGNFGIDGMLEGTVMKHKNTS